MYYGRWQTCSGAGETRAQAAHRTDFRDRAGGSTLCDTIGLDHFSHNFNFSLFVISSSVIIQVSDASEPSLTLVIILRP